jgi:hypothetical protein
VVLRSALVALVVALVAVLPARPADAQQPPSAAPLAAEALGDLSPGLIGVVVEGAGYAAAHERWIEAGRQARLAAAEAQAEAARAADLEVVRDRVVAELDDTRNAARAADARHQAARQRLVGVAVAAFRSDDANVRLNTVLGGNSEVQALRRGVLGGAVEGQAAVGLVRTEEAAVVAVAAAERVADHLGQVVTDHDAALVRRGDALGREHRWWEGHDHHQQVMAAVARSTRVVAVGLPTVVLDAYWRGSQHPAATCRLPWHVLAGIGRIESRHGTYGGSSPDERGRVSPPIIGIPLDGTNGTMHIADTDGGAHDGDAVYDRAVGPMQFIPGTWRAHGLDGNGDGATDPHSLYDAAASAAAYLCKALPADGDLRRAIFAYNRSSAYVEDVLGHARAYAAADLTLGAVRP